MAAVEHETPRAGARIERAVTVALRISGRGGGQGVVHPAQRWRPRA